MTIKAHNECQKCGTILKPRPYDPKDLTSLYRYYPCHVCGFDADAQQEEPVNDREDTRD